ncbi:MAG TPA: response regulator transcription factor [Flavisolibacter sp.]|nr:response regulator transcription factor [Flavisolibacter sp.]
MNKISIVIAETQLLLRQGLIQVLDAESKFKVVGEAGTGDLLVQQGLALQPDILLVDTNLPDLNTVSILKLIRFDSPRTSVIAMTPSASDEQTAKMIGLGALGFITKEARRDELFKAIIKVHKGERFISAALEGRITFDRLAEEKLKKLDALTHKEMNVASLIQFGYTSKEIAKKLSISEHTINVHRYNILKKLNLRNSICLINFISF